MRTPRLSGTGPPPEVRTWLHLHDPDPGVGRLRARCPGIEAASPRVTAFRLPRSLSRREVKGAVIAHLAAAGLPSGRYMGDRPRMEPGGEDLSSRLGGGGTAPGRRRTAHRLGRARLDQT
ncbi:hypothetical protein [Streptosporangium sp. NPDC002721]|uniref:hypothetical protein n=1 Tax=Streptosporangium sp. NPDC002721 TaxID=3366188 RepID=UPI003698FB9E